MSIIRTLSIAAAALVAGVALSACTGSDDESGETGDSPEEVLAQAKETIDETPGVRISLTTSDLPSGVQGVAGADGIGTHDPAFDGTIKVFFGGTNVEVPVIAVDGRVYAQIPLVPGWSDIDPTEYGAPDPAGLMDTETGLSSLLTATEDVEEGESVRGGSGNREVLTEYTGTVPGEAVQNIIPSASGDFDAAYTITDQGELRTAALTGVFYPDTEPMTYTVAFDDYGIEKEIRAP